MSEVRGTGKPHDGTYPYPVRLIVRPHDTHHYPTVDERAETDKIRWLKRTLLRTILTPFEGVQIVADPVQLDELHPADPSTDLLPCMT